MDTGRSLWNDLPPKVGMCTSSLLSGTRLPPAFLTICFGIGCAGLAGLDDLEVVSKEGGLDASSDASQAGSSGDSSIGKGGADASFDGSDTSLSGSSGNPQGGTAGTGVGGGSAGLDSGVGGSGGISNGGSGGISNGGSSGISNGGSGGIPNGGSGGSACQSPEDCFYLDSVAECKIGNCVGQVCVAQSSCGPNQLCCNGTCAACCSDSDCGNGAACCENSCQECCSSDDCPLDSPECCPDHTCGECCGAGVSPQCAALDDKASCKIGVCAVIGHYCHAVSCLDVGQQCCEPAGTEPGPCCS